LGTYIQSPQNKVPKKQIHNKSKQNLSKILTFTEKKIEIEIQKNKNKNSTTYLHLPVGESMAVVISLNGRL